MSFLVENVSFVNECEDNYSLF